MSRHRPSTSRLSPLGCAFALLPTLMLHAAVTAQGYDAALARYKECIQRVPFRHHTEGREELAKTGKPEALDILVKDYDKPQSQTEHSRYTLASLFGRHFDAPESVAPLRSLRMAHDDAGDAWLWANVLRIEANRDDIQRVLDIATGSKDYRERAAAILAIGAAKSSKTTNAVLRNCVDFPRKEADRNILLGAMAGALYENRAKANDDSFRDALRAYANLLADDVKLSDIAQLQIARHLQLILNSPKAYAQPEPWLQLLDRGDVQIDKNSNTVAAPRFFGIETDGVRFCYVVDLSDSMCKEIHPSLRPTGPVTGPKPQKKPKGVLPDESDLPWHLIRTRFDLAREQLKISLQRLSKDQYFSVVIFGTEAETLRACPGMVKATKGNVARAIKELEDKEIGPKDAVKAPEGTLMGRTNMHAGLRLAFGLSGKGYVAENAYVDPATLVQGCDTIFLLSDGAPSWDNFDARDKDYGEGRVVVDTEYGTEAPRTAELVYQGPYTQDEWLVEDIRRMNAFRRVRLHCIGIGEAKMDLLKRLADLGHGEVIVVGKK